MPYAAWEGLRFRFLVYKWEAMASILSASLFNPPEGRHEHPLSWGVSRTQPELCLSHNFLAQSLTSHSPYLQSVNDIVLDDL